MVTLEDQKSTNFIHVLQFSFFLKNKKRVGAILIALLLIALIHHEYMHGVNDHSYETSLLSEFEGIYFDQPYPSLVFDETFIPKNVGQHALIVGPGKSGAQEIVQQLEEQHGSFNGKSIRLRGTLYTTNNKTLIELSQGKDALLAIERSLTYPVQRTAKKPIELTGEIVNAKCWLSQQEVREGYYHSRCTKACIKKGIPPLLKVKNKGGNTLYVLAGLNEDANADLFKHIAQLVTIKGEVNFQNGWSVLSFAKGNISPSN